MNLSTEHANKPNLWRVACELSKFKKPDKALDMLLALVGPMLREGDHDE